MPPTHVHEVANWPNTSSGSGYGVCACGATVAVYHGKPSGPWHACKLCVYTPGEEPSDA